MGRRIRLIGLLFFASALAFAAEPGLKELFDPTRHAFPLRHWSWEDWEALDKPTKLRSKGVDPATWADPPPDPPDPEEERKRKEEERRKKEAQAKDPLGPTLPKYPEDRWPGFKFDERLRKKQAAFEKMVQPASASRLEGLVKLLRKLDKYRSRFDKEIGQVTGEYVKLRDQLDKSTEPYVKQYKKKHGHAPDVVPVNRVLKREYDRRSRQLQTMLAVRQSEEEFDGWLVERLGELIADLSPEERSKPVAALTAGMKDSDWKYRVVCARLLGRLGDAISVANFRKAMESEKDPLVLAELVRIRAGRGGDGLLEFLAARLDDPSWPVRATVVRELARLRTRAAVDLLVKRMQSEDGRLLDDIAEALRGCTGKDFVPEPDPWRIWWEKARATWTPPKVVEGGVVAADAKPDGAVYFYGIRSSSKRVVFCIDISGSMEFPLDGRTGKQPPRIETAKRELLAALSALPEDARFNVVVYSAEVKVWKPRMQKADARIKAAARNFVEKLKPQGPTNIFDALVTSMDLAASLDSKRKKGDPEADTIFFLTDGVPTHGRLVEPHRILEEISRRNAILGLKIHAIGVSKEQNKAFLFNLARRNGGTYVGKR